MINQENILKQKFKQHIHESILRNILLISGLGVLALFYYMYSDFVIRQSIQAFYMRLLPMSIGFPLFFLHLVAKDRFKKVKIFAYNMLLTSAVVMMYGVCIVHLHDDALAPSVTGTVLVIFIISLEIKTNRVNTLVLYFLPILIFTLSLVFIFKPLSTEFTIIADIYPIIMGGFAINRLQKELRYKLFKSNYLLDLEKQKTEKLYKETLVINADLKVKADLITVHKEEIEEKNEKLQESNATKDKFLAIIAHDLIGPFNIMKGFSDLLVESFNENNKADQKEYANQIQLSVDKTYRLLENLLIWARSQKDALEFKLQNVNLFLLVAETLELLSDSIEAKSINTSNFIAYEIIVEADKNMLATILRNLISNAIKFTPKEGNLALESRFVEGDANQKYIEIIVKDSGLGISKDVQSKLFDISENISTKGTNNETGTGLGLILCKEFVEKHGGEIKVESQTGKGSNFIFTLPLNSQKAML